MNDKIVLATIFSFLASIVWVVVIYKIDKHEKEPIPLLIKLFITSMILSFVAAFFNRLDAKLFGEFGSLILVGFIEEGVKFLAVWLIVFKHKEFNSPIDGVIYASISALGFAFVENIEYNFLMLKHFDHQVVNQALFVRAFMPFMHVLMSSIWGYALGMYKLHIFNKQKLIIFFLLGAIAHSSYDILVTIIPFIMTLLFAILITFFIFKVIHLNRVSKVDIKYFIECPNCTKKVPENSLFCKYCGNKIVFKPFTSINLYCKHCLHQVQKDWSFCKYCGKIL